MVFWIRITDINSRTIVINVWLKFNCILPSMVVEDIKGIYYKIYKCNTFVLKIQKYNYIVYYGKRNPLIMEDIRGIGLFRT